MSLFADDMTVHMENPMQYTKKSLSLARLKDTKINIEKLVVLLYTKNKLSEECF